MSLRDLIIGFLVGFAVSSLVWESMHKVYIDKGLTELREHAEKVIRELNQR